LTANTPLGNMRGPKTPFSPESVHIKFEVNPERHVQLASAKE